MSSSSFYNLGVTGTANINNLNVTTVTGASIISTNAIVTSFTATNVTGTNIFGPNVTATNLTTTTDATINDIKIGKGPLNVTNNLAIGGNALRVATSSPNVAIGNAALFNNTTGTYNVAIGVNSLYTNTVGFYNTAIGVQASFVSTSSNNTAIGTGAGYRLSSGSNNTIIGTNAGNSITTGSNNTVIGSNAGLGLSTQNNCIAIGYNSSNALATTNQIVLGTTAHTIYIQGGLNYCIGASLTGSATPPTPMGQFYPIINGATNITITLPTPSVSTNGTFVIFKRGIGSTGTISFDSTGGGNVMIGTNSIATASTLGSYGSGVYNFQFIGTTANWCQII